jgi:two-component system, chemotaxis family, response regulator Rcp1
MSPEVVQEYTVLDRDRRNCRIWVVEDNRADVILLRHALQTAEVQCEIEIITDGGVAMNRLVEIAAGQATPPHLFILDVNLPRENGLEVLARLRNIPQLQTAPVLILTSSDSPRERNRAEALGIQGFFNKPSDLGQLDAFAQRVKQIVEERTQPAPLTRSTSGNTHE